MFLLIGIVQIDLNMYDLLECLKDLFLRSALLSTLYESTQWAVLIFIDFICRNVRNDPITDFDVKNEYYINQSLHMHGSSKFHQGVLTFFSHQRISLRVVLRTSLE